MTGHPVRLAILVFLALMATGCFRAARSLLLPADLAQPVESGRWRVIGRTTPDDYARLAPDARSQCTAFGGSMYCPRSIQQITRNRDGSYTTYAIGQPEQAKALRLSSMGDNLYVFEAVRTAGAPEVEYSVAQYIHSGGVPMFSIHVPNCSDLPWLHDLAAPRPAMESVCDVPSRRNLIQLMGRLRRNLPDPDSPTFFYIRMR